MNFRFSKEKTISSIILGLIYGIYRFLNAECIGSCPSNIFKTNKPIEFLIGFILVFVVIYVIWSLIQKKK